MNLSIIEGFYGQSWSFKERCQLFKRFAELGFNSYCYAPKSDRLLRNDWQQLWSDDQLVQLIALSENAAEQGIHFDIGLSPLGLGDNWNANGQQLLTAKLEQIKQLNPKRLAVLFDDMRGDSPELAVIQADIMRFISEQGVADQLIFCPSYYSFDPVLEELFGNKPTNYWQDLGRMLAPDVDVFWTGDKVISSQYTEASIDKIAQQLQRQPMLWDNSLANDGRKTSPYLKFDVMAIRQDRLPSNIAGVYFNPMNQAAVLDIVLPSFFYVDDVSGEQGFNRMTQPLPQNLQNALMQYQNVLRNNPIDGLNRTEKQQIRETLQAFENPIAQTLLKWLDNSYQFDPNCLT